MHQFWLEFRRISDVRYEFPNLTTRVEIGAEVGEVAADEISTVMTGDQYLSWVGWPCWIKL